MTLHQESLIEAFALSPGSLSDAETADVIALINADEEAEELHTWLSSFYHTFKSQDHLLTDRLERFIASLTEHRDSVRLLPRRTARRDSRTGHIAAPKLAAATRMHRAFELIGSSMTEDGRTDVRFIRDVAAGMVRVYVVAEDVELIQSSLILFDGSSVHLLTDEHGQASISEKLFEQVRLIERDAFIRPVRRTFTIDTKELGKQPAAVGPPETPVRARASATELIFDFDSDTIVAFGGFGTDPKWQHIHPGAGISIGEAGSHLFSVRVYG